MVNDENGAVPAHPLYGDKFAVVKTQAFD